MTKTYIPIIKISLLTLLLSLLTATVITASTGKQTNLSDEQSDPIKLGLMKGFPPKSNKRVMLPDSNFFSFPNLRWSVCNMRELLPTASIERNIYGFKPLKYNLMAGIDEVTFRPTNSKRKMTWGESLAKNYTDGMLIIHKDRIIYEKYRGCMTEYSKHAAMSMTKSVTGLIAEILIAQGKLDESATVATIIPELVNSAFADATVRQVMDMTTSLKYSENYADPNADIWVYSAAANPLPKPKDYHGPVGYFEYLQTIKKESQHGIEFGYKTVNSDALGWILARVSGKKFNQLASELLWSPLGMELSADITVDGLGIPFAGGGLSASMRDLARLGLAMSNNGIVDGLQIIPKAAIQSIGRGGDKNVFAKAGFKSMPNGSYRSMWWHFHNKNGAYAARGVHGQTIYIDPTADMVIVRLASHPTAANGAIDPTSLPAYEAMADFLLAQ